MIDTQTRMTDSSHNVVHRLQGKRALVTAAAQGVGEAIARRLADEGATVLATDLNGERLVHLQHRRIETKVFDASDAAAVASAIAGRKAFDILVNCVGWVHQGTVLDADYESWTRSFKLNVDPMFHAIRAVLPGMLGVGRGSIINIASAASSIMGFPNRAAYGASKAAVVGLTKSLSGIIWFADRAFAA